MSKADNEFYIVRKSLEQSLRELPPLPTAVTKVLQEMQQPEPSSANVEKIIAGDQALASKVLRVVNSAYYGVSRQVTNVGQAIIILGLQQVRNIVLSVGSMAAFNAKTPRQLETMQRFWQHSFGCGAVCNLLAPHVGWDRKKTETAFTAGILHDIGRLFLFCNFGNTYDKLIDVANDHGITFEEAEVKMLGMGHGAIGGVIAEEWGLPVALVECIRNHEGPFETLPDELTSVVHFGDWLNKKIYFEGRDVKLGELDPSVKDWLNLSDEHFEQIAVQTWSKVEEAKEMFGMSQAA